MVTLLGILIGLGWLVACSCLLGLSLWMERRLMEAKEEPRVTPLVATTAAEHVPLASPPK